MYLYEICSQVIIQGNICVKVFHNGQEEDSRYYRDMDDFDSFSADIDDLEECEVRYIYPTKACDGTQWLVIEVAEV